MSRWLALVCLSGCSLTLTELDPQRPKTKAPQCDTGKGAVFADGLMATIMGLTAIGLASNNEGGAAVAPLVLGAVFLGSAVHGNTVVDHCRAAMDDFGTVATRRPLPPGIDEDDDVVGSPQRPAPAAHRGVASAAPKPGPAPAPGPMPMSPYPEPDDEPAPPAPPAPTPAPVATPPVAAPTTPRGPAPRPAPPPPPPPPSSETWHDFWREVP